MYKKVFDQTLSLLAITPSAFDSYTFSAPAVLFLDKIKEEAVVGSGADTHLGGRFVLEAIGGDLGACVGVSCFANQNGERGAGADGCKGRGAREACLIVGRAQSKRLVEISGAEGAKLRVNGSKCAIRKFLGSSGRQGLRWCHFIPRKIGGGHPRGVGRGDRAESV
mmetsp:Transcript_14529/g.23109  ORF Transcript_14529/g.23109 Transcript_14529/m.23109 type:complete len:166 (+) Transcript_14529:149-646(+)